MDSGSARAFGPGVEVDVAAFVHPTAQIYGDVQVAAAARVERTRLEAAFG